MRTIEPKIIELPKSAEEKIAFRADHLVAYQGKGLARRYRKRVDGIADEGLRLAVAQGYHKLLAYKDEYEVARLLLSSQEKAAAEFDGDFRMTFHLAPPILSKTGSDGRPVKRSFGPWMAKPLKVLSKLKRLRGTPLDIFGYASERRMERSLIKQYERDLKDVLPLLNAETRDPILALALLPLQIRGFGPVKHANAEKAAKRRDELLATIRAGGVPSQKAAE